MASIGKPGKGKRQTGAGRHTPKTRKGTRGEKKRAAIEEETGMGEYGRYYMNGTHFIVEVLWTDDNRSFFGPFDSKDVDEFVDEFVRLNEEDIRSVATVWCNTVAKEAETLTRNPVMSDWKGGVE